MRRLALGLVAGLAVFGCQESEPEPTFRDVQGVFVDHGCAEGSCHNAGSRAGGLDLEGDAAQELINVPCSNLNADESGLRRVVPESPEDSFLMLKLELLIVDPELGMPMPPNGGTIDHDDLDLIEAWIIAGAPAE